MHINRKTLGLILITSLGLLAAVFLSRQRQDIRNRAYYADASLIITPSTGSFNTGDTIPVLLKVNSGGEKVIGISVNLDYDPNYLSLSTTDVVNKTIFTDSLPMDNLRIEDGTNGRKVLKFSYTGIFQDVTKYPSGTFDIAQVNFHAVQSVQSSSAIIITASPPSTTTVSFQAPTLLGYYTGGWDRTIKVAPAQASFQIGSTVETTPTPTMTGTPDNSASLGCYVVSSDSPTATIHVGDTFAFAVKLNSPNKPVYGAKIIGSYSSNLLDAIVLTGVPLTSFPNWTDPLSNTVDDDKGTFVMDYGNNQPAYQGSSDIGYFKFKAVQPGQAQFIFNFFQQYDDTTSDVAKIWGKKDGVNISNVLTDVTSCVVIIESAILSPSPTPIYTAYPTTGPAVLPRIGPGISGPSPWPSPCSDYKSSCPLKPQGDGDCNQSVNENDYTVWLSQYDKIPPAVLTPNANYLCVNGNTRTYFIDLVDYEAWRRGQFPIN